MAKVWEKRADEALQFKFDFAPFTNLEDGARSDWLASGETLIDDTTITADSGVTIASYGRTDSNTSVTFIVSGGTAGSSYTITCQSATSAGQTVTREKELKIIPRYT